MAGWADCKFPDKADKAMTTNEWFALAVLCGNAMLLATSPMERLVFEELRDKCAARATALREGRVMP